MKILKNWLFKFGQFEINEDCTFNFYRNKGDFVAKKYKEREEDRIERLIQDLIKDSNLVYKSICVHYNLDGEKNAVYFQQGLIGCTMLGKIDVYEYKDGTITFKETREDNLPGFFTKKYKERKGV